MLATVFWGSVEAQTVDTFSGASMKRIILGFLAAIAFVGRGHGQPSTLLEMSGSQPPFDFGSSVVVLIDFQNEYVTGRLPLYRVEESVSETKKLLAWARKAKIPVVHVLHKGKPSGLFDVASRSG